MSISSSVFTKKSEFEQTFIWKYINQLQVWICSYWHGVDINNLSMFALARVFNEYLHLEQPTFEIEQERVFRQGIRGVP